MGKLVKFLEGIRRGGQGFGFAARQEKRGASLALVVAGASGETTTAASAGADAVALVLDAWDAKTAKTVMSQLPAEKARGILLGKGQSATQEAVSWEELGVDFVILGEEHPAALLLGNVERIARVDTSFEPTQVRALESLGMDAFCLAVASTGGSNALTIGDLAKIRLLVGVTGKPVLVVVGDPAFAGHLESLVQTGIEGIILEGTAAAESANFRQAIDNLGPRKPQRRRPGDDLPLIPRAAATPQEEFEGPDGPELPDTPD